MIPRWNFYQYQKYCYSGSGQIYVNWILFKSYAPSVDKYDEEIEQFYDQIDTTIKLTKRGEITITSGGCNSKVGQGPKDQ